MDHGPRGSSSERIDRLPAAGHAPAAAVELERILVRAGSPDVSASEAAELDARAARAATQAEDAEALLYHVPLDRWAGLAERAARRLEIEGGDDARHLAWLVLDLLRSRAILVRIAPEARPAWAARILELVQRSDYTVGVLLRQRAERYGDKPLFRLDPPAEWGFRRVASRVELFGRALLALAPETPAAPIAFVSENSLEMAILDVACLGSGLVNVMAPATATESDIGFILEQSGAGAAIVGGPQQLAKVLKHRERLRHLHTVISIDPRGAAQPGVLSLEALAARAEPVPRGAPRARSERVSSGELATVMYTSGTTGTPKGIRFSHQNIVFKRFARALALPEIGEDDVFLSFLPLYHTFGRFLELLGCIFWGATYCFLSDPSPRSLVQAMRRHRPTVFISVPKKWMQLHELIAHEVDPVGASDAELLAATRQLTGGRLRYGLSAAGHLDAEVFRFFQRQGIELLSGFGMTEATGGITMTPPGRYEDHSLGLPLPGIEARLAEDGELLVRGPYVMLGYVDGPEAEPAFDASGWFHTGDLMQETPSGHLRLVDRKKEIYKNTKGETIAPQRVENMFREFAAVGRAFLVGDHRDYNTLLIWPNPDYTELDLAALSEEERRDHFRSIVASVNQFLAPYERVVDFALIGRDLDAARGELTPKATPRRKTVEESFRDTIRELYRRTSLRLGGVELVIPNWLLQILGLTAQDLRYDACGIVLRSRGTRLAVDAAGPGVARVGSCRYRYSTGSLNLGALLTTPRLWLGNEELVAFVPLDTVTRQRARSRPELIEWLDRPSPYAPSERDRTALEGCRGRADLDLLDLDLAARMLASPDETDARLALAVLEELFDRAEGPLAEPARLLLAREATSPRFDLRRAAFRVLAPAEKASRFPEVLDRFLAGDPELFDVETRLALAARRLGDSQLEALIERTRRVAAADGADASAGPLATSLLAFLSEYGALHPGAFRRLRAFLERESLFAGQAEVQLAARRACEGLITGFRAWLGPTPRVALDPERGREYGWEDVVVFDDGVFEADRRRLFTALSGTALLREGVFLFSEGTLIELASIPPGGARVRLLGRRHGKSVYRLTVQTRFQGTFELAVNLNHELAPETAHEEIQWLVLCGDPGDRREPLVEEFGGAWPAHDLWSEEFIEGEPLERAMRRLSGMPGRDERLRRLWPFMAWATLAAYVDFWHRSGQRLELGDADMTNVVVPTEDFLLGVRIVSVARRRPHRGLLAMLRGFREFVSGAEAQHPILRGVVGWPVIFSSVLEVLGENEGLARLEQALGATAAETHDELQAALGDYVRGVAERGFVPMRLYFAVERYRRWAHLSADATPQARALTLQELYETYGLERLVKAYPEIRVQLFRETVLRDCSPALDDGLRRIVRSIRNGALAADDLIHAVDELRAEQALGPDDDYFLARLSYPHLRPQDAADFVDRDLGGRRQSDLVVTLEDADGTLFRVRHVMNPKEVERLLRLFLGAKLDVHFRLGHQYLVAVNERSQIIGGIYYEIDEAARSAHLEKIVVAERYRGKRVADGLMGELINRLRSAGIKTLTTGFFRSDYFYGFGFRVEKRSAGLVRDLTEPDPPRREGG